MDTLHPIDKLPPRAAAGERILVVGLPDQLAPLKHRIHQRGFKEDAHFSYDYSLGPGRLRFISHAHGADDYIDRHGGADLNMSNWDHILDAGEFQPLPPENRYASTISELAIVQRGWESKVRDPEWFTTPTKTAVRELLNDLDHVIKKNLGDRT